MGPDVQQSDRTPLEYINGKLMLGKKLIEDAETKTDDVSPDTDNNDEDIVQIEPNLVIQILFKSIPQEAMEKLGVNVGRLCTWMRIAGIDEILITDTATIESQNMPNIAGHTPWGEALGSFLKGGTKAPRSISEMSPLIDTVSKSKRFNILVVNGDPSRIGADISEENVAGVRSAEGWAKELNTEIKNAILKNGLRNLLTPDIATCVLESGFFIFATLAIGGSFSLPALMYILWNILIDRKVIKPDRENLSLEYCPTYVEVGDMYLDRAVRLAVDILVRNNDIFFVLESKQEKTPSLPPNL